MMDDNDKVYLRLVDDFLGETWMSFTHFLSSHGTTGSEVVSSHNKIFGTKLTQMSFNID